MWLLLQILGLLSVAAAAFVTAIYKYISLLQPQSASKQIESASENISNEKVPSYILRKKDYETYQGIKYGAGVKSAKMIGSTLILIDLDLIKAVNQRDFSHFPDRHPPSYHSDPTMNKMLSFATGEEWRRLKAILTQAFSTSRIRRVHEGLHVSAIKLVDFIRDQLRGHAQTQDAHGHILEIVGPTNKYLLELIACSVFGLEDTGIFSSDDSPFEIYTKEVQKAMIRHRQARLIPGVLRIAKLFNLIRPDPNALEFFKATIEKSINGRKERGEKGDDLLQLLMEATSTSSSSEDKVNGHGRLTDDMILSQAFMFFFAGTEGPATLLIYGLYELARNSDVQQKLYDEISNAMEMDSSLDYETIIKLPYLDMFVCEVLRMYSSSVTARRCDTRYSVPGTDIVLEPGTNVHTPIYGIHHDEEFYPNPFQFNPNNFTVENKARRPSGAYMPFGIGPRSCIAQKFGLVQGKSAICHLVYNFKVELCWRTESPPKGTIASMYLPVNGLWLRFEDRVIEEY